MDDTVHARDRSAHQRKLLHTAPACGPHAAARTAARTACSLPLAAVVAPPYWQGCSGSFPLLAVDAPPGAI
eukprot:scaffold26073_cov16-Tisochrysis_lutea.AAC.1